MLDAAVRLAVLRLGVYWLFPRGLVTLPARVPVVDRAARPARGVARPVVDLDAGVRDWVRCLLWLVAGVRVLGRLWLAAALDRLLLLAALLAMVDMGARRWRGALAGVLRWPVML